MQKMAHEWDSYCNNLQLLSSDPTTLKTSEADENLSQHIENFNGHHDFPGSVASNEAPATNSNFSSWQADEQMENDYLPNCGNSDIEFATDGLLPSESFSSCYSVNLQGLKQDCGMPTSFLDDYSDVSSCSDTDVGETRLSCKFMANNSVPKLKTDVSLDQTSSEWFFTQSGKLAFPTENPCPSVSEINVMLQSPSNLKADEKIVECSQDELGIPECSVKSAECNQFSAPCNMVTTVNENVEDGKNQDGWEEHNIKESIESDLTQRQYSNILTDRENLTIDGTEKPDDSDIILTDSNIMTTFDIEQENLNEQVPKEEMEPLLHQENEAFDNPDLTNIKGGTMEEDKEDMSEVSNGERKETGSFENENFENQKSSNFISCYSQDEILQEEVQDKNEVPKGQSEKMTSSENEKCEKQNSLNHNSSNDQDENMTVDEKYNSKVLKGERKESGPLENEHCENQASPDPKSADGQDDIQREEQNRSEILKGERKALSSVENENCESQKSLNSNSSNDQDENMTDIKNKTEVLHGEKKESILFQNDDYEKQKSSTPKSTVGQDEIMREEEQDRNVLKSENKESGSLKNENCENQNLQNPISTKGEDENTKTDSQEKRIKSVPFLVSEPLIIKDHELASKEKPEGKSITSSTVLGCIDPTMTCSNEMQQNTLQYCLQSNTVHPESHCPGKDRTSQTQNMETTLSPNHQQAQHQNSVTLEPKNHCRIVSENTEESFEESDRPTGDPSVLGAIYGEPLSREGSVCDTDETNLEPSQHEDASMAKPHSINHTEGQPSQLQLSIQLRKVIQPVVIIKSLDSNVMSNLYHCAVCQHTTHSVDHLIEHHHSCHQLYNVQYCKTCKVYLLSDEQAKKHSCGVIELTPESPSDSIPRKKRNGDSRKCIRCGLKFAKFYQYVKHMRIHTGITPYRCNACGVYFSQSGSLKKHKIMPGRCKQTSVLVSNSDAVDAVTEIETPLQQETKQNKQYGKLPDCYVKLVDMGKTDLCDSHFKSSLTDKESRKHHYNVHKGKNESVLASQQSTTNLGDGKTPNMQVERKEKYQCPLCARLFKYSYNRARHLRICVRDTVYGGKAKVSGKYQCPLCKALFTMASNRSRHIKNICLKEFVNRLAKESPNPRHQTEQIQTRTKQKTQLKENEEPTESKKKSETTTVTYKRTPPLYKCSLCPAVFHHASGKYRHLKKHELFKLTGKIIKYRKSVFSAKSIPATLSIAKTDEKADTLKSTKANSSPELSCHFCGKCFSTSSALKRHEVGHKGERPYHCLDCGKGFKRRSYLIGHKIIHQRRIQCTVCRKILPTIKELIQHRSTHLKKGMLQCPDCNLQFQYPVYLLRHLESHKKKENKAMQLEEKAEIKLEQSLDTVKEDKSESKQLQCSLCKKAFKDAQILRKHCLTHISESSLHQCPFCKQKFTNRQSLLRHMTRHTGDKPFSCTNCGKRFYRDIYLKHHSKYCLGHVNEKTKTKPRPSHQCLYCPRMFFKKIRLKNHHYAHKLNSLLLCKGCGQYFGFTRINLHQKDCAGIELNTGISPNSDLDNSTSQTSQQVPKVTLQSSATKTLPFACTHCTQKFRYKSLLLRHLVSHTGLQPHACTRCGNRYSSQTKLLQHEVYCDGVSKKEESKRKTDAENTTVNLSKGNEVEYKCRFCNKTFMKPRYLRRHILSHNEVNPYRCKRCDSCFSRYDHLKVHQTNCEGKGTRLEVCIPKISLDDIGKGWQNKYSFDTAEKLETFDCKVCSKNFSTQSLLSRHKAMFHVTKLYKCTGCDSSFRHECSLKKHLKKKRCRKISKETAASPPLETEPSTENVKNPLDILRNRILQRTRPHLSKKLKYMCSYCPRVFGNSSQLRVHTYLHTGERPYPCDYCDERFIRKDYLQRHFQKCTEKAKQNKVLCDRCGEYFSQVKFENHRKSCNLTSTSANPTVCLSQPPVSGSPPKGFSCAFCSSRFLLFSQLQEHFITTHKTDTMAPPVSPAPLQHHLSSITKIKEEPLDEICDKQLTDGVNVCPKLEKTIDMQDPSPFSCPECNLSFMNKAGLTGHLRVHTKEVPFHCKTCNKGFWNKSLLRNHYRKCRLGHLLGKKSTQELEVPLKADIDFALNDSILLFKGNSRTTGTGVLQTNFSCKEDSVDESEQNSEDNEVHGNSSKEKKTVQYQCSECEKTFTDGLMLISHLEDHGREEHQRKLNTCPKCGRVCTSQVYLKKHMKIHEVNNKIPCPDCPKLFDDLSALEVHKACHDPNRSFPCKLCNLRFRTRISLCEHFGTDHPDAVFSCRFCDKSYSLKKSLSRHYKKWHQNEKKELMCIVQKRSSEKQQSGQVSTTGESEDESSKSSDSDTADYFPCHVCGKTFPTSESLEDHQRCHLGEKPHECAECGKCFTHASQLQQHQRMHKSEFQCQTCGRGFVSFFALRKHKHTHGKSRPYRCSKCHLSFTGPSQLAEHMSTHREENFPCDICNRVFLSKSSRAEHRKTHSNVEDHNPPSVPKEENQMAASVSDSSTVINRELKYRCGVCNERFKDPELLSEHGCLATNERQYSCVDCDKHFLHASHLKKHTKNHQISPPASAYQCNQCNTSFSSSEHFLSHLKTHVDTPVVAEFQTERKDEGPSCSFKCPVCPQWCATATELICHFSLHSESSLECKDSKKTFPSAGQVEEDDHLLSAARYECTVCGQGFVGSKTFWEHHCSHQQHTETNKYSDPPANISASTYQAPGEDEEIDVTGEDLYYCPVCAMQFSSKSSLLDHQNKQHPVGKPFKCELCGKAFSLRRYLREHERRHQKSAAQNKNQQSEKFRCTQCCSEFNSAQELSLHMRFHAEKQVGEYRCDMCYKSFSHWSLLRQHQESHMGQVVYECNECDKAFAFPQLLEEHQLTHAASS